jgi:type VI secretion system protein ImpH
VATQKRQPRPSLKERLFEEFYGFSFFKAVRLLELVFPERKPLGQTLRPTEEVVRFKVKPGFTFPPSDIAGLRQDDAEKPPEMEVAFMGLIGPSGVLPYWYNELAMERVRQKDLSLTSFLDLFHHRLISLFYLAWKKSRVSENYHLEGQDKLSRYLLSLIGLGTAGLRGRMGLPDESLIFGGGFLSRPVPSVVALEATVGYFSDTAVQVEQFIDREVFISPEDQTQLGSANARLGVDALCGSRGMENQTKFRLCLGPMGYEHFFRLLPMGDLLQPIFSLVRYMVGIEYEFEIRLILRREEVPPCVLGGEIPGGSRLGWSTWIQSPGIRLPADASVTFYES